MDARKAGYGYLVPIPRYTSSHLGHVVYIDDEGVVQSVGRLADDEYFNMLPGSGEVPNASASSEEYPGLTVAFTTGCLEVKTLTKREVAASLALDRSPADGIEA
jgi:hypothetical protein